MKYDVAIIGAGVIGALTARSLSRYNLRVVLLEAANDVAMGASKANSGIVHAGFDAMPGTLKAKFNVIGCAMMRETCEKLSVPYKNNGSLVLAFSADEMETVRALYERGLKNNVPDMEILGKEEVLAMEPNLSEDVAGALYAKSAGIVCPYELTIAATENAVANGVEFRRNFRVDAIDVHSDGFTISTEAGESVEAGCIINAAGVYADRIAGMIGDNSVNIEARRGEYFILDKTVGDLVSKTIFQCPTPYGKGVLVCPTVDGNILLGPTNNPEDDKDNTATSYSGLQEVKKLTGKSCPSVSARNAITSFAGLRAHEANDDFILGPSKVNPRFLHASGIESPGLSASPAIADYLAGLAYELCGRPADNDAFTDTREKPFMFRKATDAQREAAIKRDPAYGRIICRCESITEGEILDAIRAPAGARDVDGVKRRTRAPAGARDVDGVKRRTRAGMGRCQGGFCGSKVVELLAKELNCPVNEITKFGGKSNILFDKTK